MNNCGVVGRPSGARRPAITIIGAGPAGLLLGCLLQGSGAFDCTILERHDRASIQTRPRAGLLEHRSVELLRQHGLAERLVAAGYQHESCEFRIDGEPVVVKLAALAGGTQWVWPQQELVTDLLAAFLERDGRVHFEVTDVALHDIGSAQPSVTFRGRDGDQVLASTIVVGADGFHGVSRAAVPPGVLRFIDHEHEFAWVAILAQTPPSSPHIVYAVDDDEGFAGHMLRTPYGETASTAPPITRFYLQCDRVDDVAAWPDERIWGDLQTRLAIGAADPAWQLHTGPIVEKSILRMRSFVSEPMQDGRLFLIGDAAHVITPIGAKGMNLALHDAGVLARALQAWSVAGDEQPLAQFSTVCLRRIWECQAFSHWFTHLIHRPVAGAPDAAFRARLGTTRLTSLLEDEAALAVFARAYVGT
jgi:p-hydroxybenzoate 3-monooxygenase